MRVAHRTLDDCAFEAAKARTVQPNQSVQVAVGGIGPLTFRCRPLTKRVPFVNHEPGRPLLRNQFPAPDPPVMPAAEDLHRWYVTEGRTLLQIARHHHT